MKIIFSPNPLAGSISGKVLAANFTGQVYMWTDFSFVAPYKFVYEDYPNDYQKICYKFNDKRYFTVRFKVSPEVKSRQHEAISEAHVSGWSIENLHVSDSKYVVQSVGNLKRNPFDVQTNNCELCVGLRRNAGYYVTEMVLPALITSALTLSSVVFHLSKVQPVLLAFSIIAQLLGLILISSRLPMYTVETPTIRKFLCSKSILKITLVKFAGFNLFVTSMLFITVLILRKIAFSTSTLPPPHFVTTIMNFTDRFLPFSSTPEKDNEEQEQRGPYAHVAATLNNLIFSFFCLVYIVAITISFVF